MAYEMPVESGEQRLQRLRDRQHVWTERGFAAAVFIGIALWASKEGYFDEGSPWDLLWVPVVILAYLVVEGLFEAAFAPVDWLSRAIFRRLSSRVYSYYDDAARDEPAPDYSMAEIIGDEADPQPLPEEEEEARR